MADEQRGRILNIITTYSVFVAVVVVMLMIVIPLPKTLIDLMMALNLALSVLILLIVIRTPRASSFSIFPRLTLFMTLFGLGINVSSTRLILAEKASAKTQSAMVQAFSNIVTKGNLTIGFVMFVIILVVQLVVITKGAGRVSEVAARFTLDAMQTKNMSIDQKLANGYITAEEAQELHAEIDRDIDFYSNMDGSSKFVSGNVKAGVFITLINLIGGFIVGMYFNKMSWEAALKTYANLTIGDGLLSQVPSLFLSFATGILVTADKSDEQITDKIRREFNVDGRLYILVGILCILLGFGLGNGTQVVMLPLGAVLVFYGWVLSRKNEKIAGQKVAQEQAKAQNSAQNPDGSQKDDSVAPLDPLQLEIGYALIPLVDKEKGAELLERITRIRHECAFDMGLPVPKVRIRDNMSLEPDVYSFKIRGIEKGSGQIRLNSYLCMDTGAVTEKLSGIATRDPTFGMPAIWLSEDQLSDAEQAGYVVVDPPTVIATHITEIIKRNASTILTREDVKKLVDAVDKTNPVVVQEVLHGERYKFTYGDIEKVLKGLLEERVSIRDMVTLLETLANYGPTYGGLKNGTWELIEKVRQAFGLQICLQYADSEKNLHVLNLSQKWTEKFLEMQQIPADGSRPFAAFDPVDGRAWIRAADEALQKVHQAGYLPVIMCSSVVRQLVKNSIERELPGAVVISEKEILAAGNEIKLQVLDEIRYSDGIL